MTYQVYRPQAVLLPADSGVSRTLLDQRSHLPGRPELTDADYLAYETDTVFHDVFLHADGTQLNAIGPPLINLQKHLMPIVVTAAHHGKSIELRHRQSNHGRVTLHSWRLPAALRQATELDTLWTFASGQQERIVAKRQQLHEVQLQFVTLQKNNPIDWVLDWLRYCRLIGVQRVMLYDNKSDNISQLEAALDSATGLPDVVLIHWPYSYGPSRSRYNRFCQPSQNNHVYQCFGQSQWTGHFDVDEYLVMRHGQSLGSLLDSAPWYWGLLRFDSYWVPDVENVLSRCQEDSLPSARDFSYREAQPRGKAHKYIVRNRRLVLANTHNARVSLGFWRKAIDTSDAVFLHYKSLTDDWRGYEKRRVAESFNAQEHVKDDAVQQLMQDIDDVNTERPA